MTSSSPWYNQSSTAHLPCPPLGTIPWPRVKMQSGKSLFLALFTPPILNSIKSSSQLRRVSCVNPLDQLTGEAIYLIQEKKICLTSPRLIHNAMKDDDQHSLLNLQSLKTRDRCGEDPRLLSVGKGGFSTAQERYKEEFKNFCFVFELCGLISIFRF